MSKQNFYLHLDGRAVKVSEEVYREYYRGERKERYFMEDLKTEKMVVDDETKTVTFIPSREDSYERLLEHDKQFASWDESAADAAITHIFLEKLEVALHTLSNHELELIQKLFYLEKTEREVAAMLQVTQNTVNYRKHKVLDKLKRLIEK